MKGIKKNLITGLFACAAFNAQAEVDPFSYGIKAGLSLSPYVGIDEGAKLGGGGKKPEHGLLDNPWFTGALHGEYAFNDYVGMGLEVGYMKQGATLTAEKPEASNTNTNTEEPSIGIHSHGITVPLYLSIYPIGREEGTGILKVNLGVAPYIALSTTCSENGKEITDKKDEIEKQVRSFDVQLHAAVEYELDFGLSFGVKYLHGFLNKFDIKEGEEQKIFTNSTNQAKIKSLKTGHLTVGLGYNLAALFSE